MFKREAVAHIIDKPWVGGLKYDMYSHVTLQRGCKLTLDENVGCRESCFFHKGTLCKYLWT